MMGGTMSADKLLTEEQSAVVLKKHIKQMEQNSFKVT